MADSALNGHRSIGTVRVRVDVPDPVVLARPGEVADCLVRVHNDGPGDTAVSVRVHGLGVASSAPVVVPGLRLAAGESVELVLDLPVPESFGTGSHALAVEVTTDRPGDRPVLAPLTLSIGSLEHVTTRIEPSMLRGGRRKRFHVDVYNRTTAPTTVELSGEGQDLRVRFDRRTVELRPGERAQVRGKVRGPRRWVGDPVQHVLTVETQSNSIPRYATATYRQRALVPRRVRGGMLALAVLLVWVAIAASVVLWASRRDDDNNDTAPAAAQLVDRDGDGIADPPAADGSTPGGGDGSTTGEGGAAGGAGGAAGAGAGGAPTSTIVRGTVKAGSTGEDDGVLVTLTPVIPGADTEQQQATTAGGAPAASGGFGSARPIPAAVETREAAPADGGGGKLWPARLGTYQAGGLTDMRTVSVSSQASSLDGSWQFSQVPLRQSYEVTFAKAGYGTQSFIVTPPDDGEPVELEVELEPGDGELGGRVLGITQAAEVEITDGTLTFRSTTSTDADDFGRWDIDGVSTPGTYTVTISSAGYGTEVMQVKLGPGESRDDLVVRLSAGVGSISGTVTADGDAKGGVTLTATAGDTTLSTTSLTEGAKGTYLFPQLPLGSVFTITATAEGYITQTRSVTVDGNVTGIDFALISSTASIIGQVLSNRDGTTSPLVSAAISVSADELEVRTSSAASPVAGAFSVVDLPPGSYVVVIGRYDHPAQTRLVSLTAGQVLDLGQIVLDFEPRPPLPSTGSLTIRTVDSFGQELPGATVQLIDVGGHIDTVTRSMADNESVVQFTAVPIGTYRVRVTKNDYRPATINNLSIGLGPVERQVTMLQYGTARGSVYDAAGGLAAPTDLLDDRGNPVYATRDGTKIYVDPAQKVDPLPPATQIGPDAQEAYLDSGGRLVVFYSSGAILIDLSGPDGVPDGRPEEPLIKVQEQVGNKPLQNYELLLYRLNGTSRVCINVIPASGDAWEIEPAMQILTGTYVLRFQPLPGEVGTACTARGVVPSGFAVIPSNAEGDIASFEIADNLDQRVVVAPIPVAPYPRVSGRVLVPRVDAGTLVFDDFADATTNGLSVTLTCAGLPVTATLGGAAGDPTTFEVTREGVATLFAGQPYDPTNGALPGCQLAASATVGDFIPVDVPLNLAVALAPPYTDRVLSLALVDDPTIITGFVKWEDEGAGPTEQRIYDVPGATIDSVGPVIVGFTPTNENDPDGPTDNTVVPPDPGSVEAAVSTSSELDGFFTFNLDGSRQLLGTEAYTVSAVNYGAGSLDIEATGDGWTATGTGTPDATRVEQAGLSSPADVYLVPDPGSITGRVNIRSIRGNAALGEVRVDATPPGEPAAPASYDSASGQYTVAPAAAGTWSITAAGDTTAAPATNLYTATQRTFVAPAANVLPCQAPNTPPGCIPTIDLIELGQVDVTIRDTADNLITGAAATIGIDQVSGGASVPAGPHTATASPDSNGELVFNRLPVDATNPLSISSQYALSVVAPDYDDDEATIAVNGGTPVLLAAAPPLDVLAGSRISVVITMPGSTTITGTFNGLVSHPSVTPQSLTPLPLAGITVLTPAGAPVPEAVASAGDDPGEFVISVPIGTYQVQFAATDFVGETVSNVNAQAPNTPVPIGDIVLELQQSTVNFTTLAVLSPPQPLSGVRVQLFWGDVLDPRAAGAPDATYEIAATAAGGIAAFPVVYPGEYTLLAEKISGSGEDQNFPFIASFTVPRASGGGAFSANLWMPPVGGTLTVTAQALNSADVEVPIPAGMMVTRSFDITQVRDAGGGLANEADEGDLAPSPSTSAVLTDADPTEPQFVGLPFGEHGLTFTEGTSLGYAALTTNPDAVQVDGPETYQVTYRALDVPVTVTVTNSVTGDPVDTATVTLTAPGGSTPTPAPPSAGVYDFGGVPPESGSFTITVSDENFKPIDPQQVEILPSNTAANFNVALEPLAVITGTAQQQDTQAGPPTAFTGGTVTLFRGSGGSEAVTLEAGGVFTLPVEGGDTYRIEVVKAGYISEIVDINGGAALTAGTEYDLGDLVVEKLAEATFTMATPTQGATFSISPSAGVVEQNVAGPPQSYRVTGLTPGTQYTVTVTHPNYTLAPIQITPTIGQVISQSVSMTIKPASVTVNVGPPEARVGLALSVSPSTGVTIDNSQVANGIITATGLQPGTTYTFGITSTDYLYTGTIFESGNTISPAPGQSVERFVTMSPKPATAVLTIGGGAASAPNRDITVSPNTGVTKTGTGPYTFTGLLPNTAYTFTVVADGYIPLTRTWTTPAANGSLTETLTPFPLGSISGTVSNVPAGGANLYVCPAAAATCNNGSQIRTKALTTTDNGYSFTGFMPGNYVVRVTGAGSDEDSDPFTVNAQGQSTPATVNLSLPAPGP